MARCCGDCEHLDPATVPTQAARKIRYCTKRCTWEYADMPRGIPYGDLWCEHWHEREPLAPPAESA